MIPKRIVHTLKVKTTIAVVTLAPSLRRSHAVLNNGIIILLATSHQRNEMIFTKENYA